MDTFDFKIIKNKDGNIPSYDIELYFNNKKYFNNTIQISELFSLLYSNTQYALIEPYTCSGICVAGCANFHQKIEVLFEDDKVFFRPYFYKNREKCKDKYYDFPEFCFNKQNFLEKLEELRKDMFNLEENGFYYQDLIFCAEHYSYFSNETNDGQVVKENEENYSLNKIYYHIKKQMSEIMSIKQNPHNVFYKNVKKIRFNIIKLTDNSMLFNQFLQSILLDETSVYVIELAESGEYSEEDLLNQYFTIEEFYCPEKIESFEEYNRAVDELLKTKDIKAFLNKCKNEYLFNF